MANENGFLLEVERWAQTTPDALAYRADDATMTYAELWTMSDAVACALRERSGDREPVVVLGHKGPLMIVGFLGCLKSGHAFVPVDVEMPASRLADIASQLGEPLLLTAVELPCALRELTCEDRVVDAREVARLPFDRASVPDRSCWVSGEETHYLIFTSGSTGRPKGIEVSADNVANFMRWLRTFPVVSDGARVFLDQPPYSFDLSQYEVVGALSTGGCLHAVSREKTEDARMLFEDLRASGVQVWVSTPSFADLCLADPSFEQALLSDVRMFLFCGETLHHATAEDLVRRFPQALVVNTYGPTESTVAVTYAEIGPAELADEAPLPVGRPRPGTELRIVNPETGAPCEPGRSGEIVIVGDTVAKGYYRNPDKTAEAFSWSLRSDGRKMRAYRTGDLGRLDKEGVLHCEGRFDALVKVNGFRIELEDVERNIVSLPQVKQAVVVPVLRRGRVSHLKACVVLDASAAALDAFDARQEIRRGLAELVPAYMVPRTVKLFDELPLTCNGKLDRKALVEA